MRLPNRLRPALVLLLSLIISILTASTEINTVSGLAWTSPQQFPAGALPRDDSIRFVDAAPAVGTVLKNDPKVKLLDTTANNQWDPGETVVYDINANNVYDSGEPVVAGAVPTTSSALKPDSKIKLVDTNESNVWDLAETVVYDGNNNSLYDSGEAVVGGVSPALNSVLNTDSRIRYVDSPPGNNIWGVGESIVYDTIVNSIYDASTDPSIKFADPNNNNAWNYGEAVVRDSNGNGAYDSGEPVISDNAPALGTALKLDSKVKIIDANWSNSWDPGEAVVYDSDNSLSYGTGEPVIAGTTPMLSSPVITDFRVKYWDANSNNIWDARESVVYETIVNSFYNASIDPHIRFYDANTNNSWNTGETVIYDQNNNRLYDCTGDQIIAGSMVCGLEIQLVNDASMRFIDINRNGRRDAGEAIVYDSISNGVYDSAEPVIAGTAPPTGTLLSEPVITGFVPPLGTPLKFDTKTRLVDADGNSLWDPGEAVVYDSNNNGSYDSGDTLIVGAAPAAGTLLTEPVIYGTVPLVGTILKSDLRVKYLDKNDNNAWNPSEQAIYDGNGNGSYDSGELVLAGGAGSNGLWDVGEVVVYDTNRDGIYASIELPVAGSVPSDGTRLTIDPKVRFRDDNNDGLRDPGETVVYDSNGNSQYDSGEPVISGPAPGVAIVSQPSMAQDSLGKAWLVWNEKTLGSPQNPDIYFRTWDGSNWSARQQVTNSPSRDDANSVTALSNNTMMVLWSSNSSGNSDIYYRLYAAGSSNPSPTTNPIQLTSGLLSDRFASAVQDRKGRVWVTWARQSGDALSDIYYKYHDGVQWSSDFLLPQAMDPTLLERSPFISQTKDGMIWIVWAGNATGNLVLHYTTTVGTLETLPPAGIPASSWAPKRMLLTSNDDDDHPVLVQARDGVLWLLFQRSQASGSSIYFGTSADNGQTWVGPSSFTNGLDSNPAASQIGNKLWVSWVRRGPVTDEIWYQTSDPITNVQDVGVKSMAASPRFIRSGESILIETRVSNYGDFQESSQLTLKLNNTILTSIPLTLASGETRLIQFNWQSVQPFWGRYILTASLQAVAGENLVNQGDNSWTDGLIRVSPPGDVDRNGQVDILDAAAVAYAYGSRPGSPLWNSNADINGNGVVDILDAAQLAFYYGKSV